VISFVGTAFGNSEEKKKLQQHEESYVALAKEILTREEPCGMPIGDQLFGKIFRDARGAAKTIVTCMNLENVHRKKR
jgi:hypothetical protein